MKTSEKIATISAALVKAQAGIAAASKSATNPHFRSKYADLASVIGACKEALNAAGIAFLQPVRATERGVIVETVLLHSSGEWISEELELPVSKADAQGVGSAVTYGRRYGLQALVGVPAEDDDGNAATLAAPPRGPPRGSAAEVAHDSFQSMPADEQAFLQKLSIEIIAAHENGGDPAAPIAKQILDNEEKLALWSLLPAPVRGALKKREAQLRTETAQS